MKIILKLAAKIRIETVCSYEALEHVVEEVRKVHPYEEPGIDIYPVYGIQRNANRD